MPHDIACKTRGQDGFAALLSRRALSSPTTCRFIPALSVLPTIRELIGSVNPGAFFTLQWVVGSKAECPVGQGQKLTLSKPVTELLQLRVLRHGLLKDWNVGVGILPQFLKILVGGAGFSNISLQCVRASKLQVGQRADGFIQHDSTMPKDFLELCRRFAAPLRREVGLSAHIDRIQIRPVVKPRGRQTKFIRSSDLQSIKRLLRVCMV